jgi:hypothetical protein
MSKKVLNAAFEILKSKQRQTSQRKACKNTLRSPLSKVTPYGFSWLKNLVDNTLRGGENVEVILETFRYS